MDFGTAIKILLEANSVQVRRLGWRERGWRLSWCQTDSDHTLSLPIVYVGGPDGEYDDHNAPWVPLQEDMFAEDWEVVLEGE